MVESATFRSDLELEEVDTFKTLEDFMQAFQKQIEYFVYYVAEADNCVDYAHMERGELPFLSSFVADCISDAKGICAGWC